MGIHLCLKTSDWADIPEWDWYRHAGDREFADLMWQSGTVPHKVNPESELSWLERPKDIAALRQAVAEARLPNPQRFEQLLTILETRPDVWFYASV